MCIGLNGNISKDGWPVARATLSLDTCIFGLSLSGDAELRTDCRKMQFRHFLIELFRQEVDVVRT